MVNGLRLISRIFLLSCVFQLVSAPEALANSDEWQWKVDGVTNPFTTKGAAITGMHGLPDSPYNRYPKLTIEKRVKQMDPNYEYFEYEAPKIPPVIGQWSYRNGSGAGGPFPSEAELVEYIRTNGVQSLPGCQGKTVEPAGAWLLLNSGDLGPGQNSRTEFRNYLVRYYWVNCQEISSILHFVRDRSVLCEPGYSPENPAPGCYIPITGKVRGTLLTKEPKSPACRGNPCDAVSGDKHETVVDYRGPHGLLFERHYHSKNLDATNQLGVGWTHNYKMRIIAASNTLTGLIRPDGSRESLRNVSSTPVDAYISYNGSGRVAKRTSSTLWQVFNSDGSVESYNSSGILQSIRDSQGRVTTLAYDAAANLISVTSPFGNALLLAYDASGRLHEVTVPGGLVITYGYTDLNPAEPWTANLTSAEYADGTSVAYQYEDAAFPNNLTGVTREDSERFSAFAYDSIGRAILTEHAGGVERYTFVYSNTNTVVTHPLGQTETIAFTTDAGLQRRVTSLSKSGLVTSRAIPWAGTDFQRRPTEEIDPKGNVTKYVYSTYGLNSRTEAFGTPRARTTSYTYLNNDSDKPLTISEPNRTTSFTYDANGNPLTRTVSDTSVTPNVSRVWTYTYNSYGQVLTEDSPRTDVSDVTTYSYYTCTTGNECGLPSTITNALGHTTTFNSYNAHGQPTQITDANGLVTSVAYDMRQRLTDRCVGGTLPTCANGEHTHLDYLPTGLLDRVLNPDGSFVEYHYDPAHRLTEINDAAGNKIVYTLDNMGNRTGEDIYDPSMTLRRTHSRVFNSLNQLWKDVNAAGTANVTTVFGYDNNGNQTTTNAPLARNSTNLFDELNRLKQITDPASGITQFGYDANENLTSVSDPRNLVTSYTYSGFGDLKTQASPDTGVTTNTYDSGGNLDTSTDSRGAVTDYAYDAGNRVTSASFTLTGVTDQTITYAYDTGTNQKGRLTAASDADHTLAWTYDTHGRVTAKSQTVGGVTLHLGYGYNAAGQFTQAVLPSGSTIGYGYGANNQVTSVTLNGSTTILSGVTYDPFGPITDWTWGNGTNASRDFDADGKIMQVGNANGSSLKTFAYDDAFRITGVTDALDSTLSWTYGYDSLDRLTSASKTGITQGWTYDTNGNRLTQTGSTPSTYTNSGTSNRVGLISGSLARSYAYDNAGNTLSSFGATFTYNNRGRMVSTTNGGVTASYTYNALGQRIKRTAAGVTTLYVYDEAGHLAGEYATTGTLIQETVWLGDIPIATLRSNGSGGVDVFYVHADHLNTPRLVTDTANNIRWRWDSDPFGTTPPNENPSALGMFQYNLRFPGQQYDATVGLHYNYFRNLDPATGRYVESDPIGLGSGVNTYVYVGSNPIDGSDIFGLCNHKICGLKRGPEFDHSGEILHDTRISVDAEFLNDANHDPKCCEVRQLIFWNRCWSTTRCTFGPFDPPNDKPGNWYEDRDAFGNRARRDGKYFYKEPDPNNHYEGNKYHGGDMPGGPDNPGFYLKLRLIVVDRCSGGKTIYTSKTLRVNF